MSFSQLFHKSNSSCNYLRGNVIQSTIEHTRENLVFLNTGLKSETLCFHNELQKARTASQRLKPKSSHNATLFLRASTKEKRSVLGLASHHENAFYNVGIDKIEFLGEPKLVLPKTLLQICKRKLVWSELTKLWRSQHNRVKGFIMNSVNGGYAVAIAGYIAFLPRSLRISKKIYHSQWRMFSILNMNAKIKNIVVKELPLRFASQTKRARGNTIFPKGKTGLRRATRKLPGELKAKNVEKRSLRFASQSGGYESDGEIKRRCKKTRNEG